MRNTPITDAIISNHDAYTGYAENPGFIAALVDQCRRFENELGDAKGWLKQHEATIERLKAVCEANGIRQVARLRGRQ